MDPFQTPPSLPRQSPTHRSVDTFSLLVEEQSSGITYENLKWELAGPRSHSRRYSLADNGANSIRQPDIDTLVWTVYNYALDVCDTFVEHNVPVEIISLGNEIRNGLLWPLGKPDPGHANIARLLNSGAWSVKESSLDKKPSVMIHLGNGWDWGQSGMYYLGAG